MNKKIKQKILGITAVTLGLLTIIGLATTLGIVSNKKDENIIVDPIVNSVLDQDEKLKTDLRAVRLVKNAISKDLLIAETKLKNSETKLKKLRSEYISHRRLSGTKFVTYKTRAEAYIRQLEAQLEQRLEKI